MSNRLKVLIADDHDLMVAALRRVLAVRDDFEIVGQAKTGDDVLPLVLETRPDVVLLDIAMPGIDGIECARQIRSRRPEVRILILTAHGDVASVEAAERAGADGFIVKSIGAPDLVELLASPSEGYFLAGLPEHADAARLTPRERVVIRALAEGLTNREIGRELWISEDTVKFHLKNLYRKLGASNRAELALRARDPEIAWSSLRQMRTA
jgi:DNA-binding NarL/FixJ family response regulator